MPYSYETLTAMLTEADVDDARDEAALLLSCFAGVGRAALLCDRTKVYNVPELEMAVQRRLTHYPLQYILGQWDFYGLSFLVNEHCLIPRPDTEILVKEAVRRIPSGALAADLCTGSGCIAVALLHARPDLTCTALELYPDTLALAKKNAVRCGVADRFYPVCADLLTGGEEALQRACGARATYDAILSNPPYIPRKDLSGLAPELSFEPQVALDGGEDGLIFYRTILKDYRPLLSDGGWMFLEIGYDQAQDLHRLAKETPGWSAPEIVQDLGGRDRVAILRAI